MTFTEKQCLTNQIYKIYIGKNIIFRNKMLYSINNLKKQN